MKDTLPLGKLVYCIGACKPGHTRALPGLFQIKCTHITRTGHTKTPILQMHAYARTDASAPYSAQCSDKKGFPQLRIKFGVAKFSLRTHTALQVPMVYRIPYSCGQVYIGETKQRLEDNLSLYLCSSQLRIKPLKCGSLLHQILNLA